MKIAVLIKQVPQLQDLRLDPQTHRLVREGVALEPSSLDMVGLGAALAMKDAAGGEVVAVTMGPPQAVDVLKAAKLGGADHLILLSDAAFAGSDTLATARALADLLAKNTFDLIILGKRSLDAETGQVGPMLAGLMGLPLATGVVAMRMGDDRRTLEVTREVEEGLEDLVLPLPAVITAAEGLAEEVYISSRKVREAGDVPVSTLGAKDIGTDASHYGDKGSPTRVGDIMPVPSHRLGERVGEGSAVAEAFARFLERRPTVRGDAPRTETYRGEIWVHALTTTAGIHPATFELLGEARRLVGPEGRVGAVWIGPVGETEVATLGEAGADRVMVAAEDLALPPSSDAAADALARLVASERPGALLVPSTARGREIASLVAARLGLGLTGDIVDLVPADGGRRLVQMKPAFGGAFVAPITSRTEPDMATVRPGVFERLGGAFRGATEPLRTGVGGHGQGVASLGVRPFAVEADLLRADGVVLGVGMGVGEDHVGEIAALARQRGFGLAASRNVTDAGWLPKPFQVGLTGRSIAPDIYIAIGISGAFEHLVGLRRARSIVAVNASEEAPIFKGADFGVVGVWQEVLPVLLKVLSGRR